MAKEFAEKYIEPISHQIDVENKIPEDILEGLRELDLFGIPFLINMVERAEVIPVTY